MSTRTIRLGILGTTLGLTLACGGLPDLGDTEIADVEPIVDEDEPDPVPEPLDLFAAIDDLEVPTKAPSCPSGTSMIKYPRGGAVEVYCATHSGTREGPWTKWKRSTLLESKTYSAGQLEGPAMRFEDGQRIELTTFSAGEQTGDYAAWDTDGTLLVRGTTIGGDRHGLFIELGAEGAFGGACYAEGVEVWRTDDPEDFVTRECEGEANTEVAALE
jgi:hypothetical protein